MRGTLCAALIFLAAGCPARPPEPRPPGRVVPPPAARAGKVEGLEGWVPAGDLKDPARLEPHLRFGLTHDGCVHSFFFCEEDSCYNGLRLLADGRVRRYPITWEQIAWTCQRAADVDEKKGATVGSWRLVKGHLELKARGKSWAPVDLRFGMLDDVPGPKTGRKEPEMICMDDGPWQGCWHLIHHARQEIDDCVPEQEDAVDPEEEEELKGGVDEDE